MRDVISMSRSRSLHVRKKKGQRNHHEINVQLVLFHLFFQTDSFRFVFFPPLAHTDASCRQSVFQSKSSRPHVTLCVWVDIAETSGKSRTKLIMCAFAFLKGFFSLPRWLAFFGLFGINPASERKSPFAGFAFHSSEEGLSFPRCLLSYQRK